MYANTIAAQSLIFDDGSRCSDDDENTGLERMEGGGISKGLAGQDRSGYQYHTFPKRREEISKVSRILNMASTFLYMMNYYIVAPTSANYAIALGGTPALSGLIIGMTPIAALIAAVLYSWWANRSYKSALVFASICSIIGNLMYSMALPFNSIEMVMAGRLINGFGGARAINRRYIVDNYPLEERTAASAMFVTASALGMASGPAAAIVLDYVPNIRAFHRLFITYDSACGWLMGVLWLIYLFLCVVFFKEPARSTSNYSIQRRKRGERETSVSLLNQTETKKRKSKKSAVQLVLGNVPVVTTLIIYFILKLVLESLLSSSAIITTWYFKWDSSTSGVFLAILGLLMFPANVGVGYLSCYYEDRELIMVSLFSTLVGILSIISYGPSYSSAQYILGGVIVFVSTNVLEGVNMSLLSKTIPQSLARGTFNSGLLATEAGTLGRAVGDNFITLVGLEGIDYVLNYTFIPLGAITCMAIIATWFVYEKLESDLDEEEEDA